jgi:hypothetical protein
MLMARSPHESEATSPTSRLTSHAVDDDRRGEVEHFIRDVFARRYGADVRHFAPTLVSLQDRGEIVAAAGYRDAATSALFLERYLASPVERLLASDNGVTPERRGIVEVGHLAASRAGEGRRLISLMGPHLAAQDFTWVVGTFTRELRHLFLRIGVAPLALGMADPLSLGAEGGSWGSYYDHRPVVLAGQLRQALRRLGRETQSAGDGR